MEAREEWYRDHERDLVDAARDADREPGRADVLTCERCERVTLSTQRVIDPETDGHVWACPDCAHDCDQEMAQREADRAEHDAEYRELDRLADEMRGY